MEDSKNAGPPNGVGMPRWASCRSLKHVQHLLFPDYCRVGVALFCGLEFLFRMVGFHLPNTIWIYVNLYDTELCWACIYKKRFSLISSLALTGQGNFEFLTLRNAGNPVLTWPWF